MGRTERDSDVVAKERKKKAIAARNAKVMSSVNHLWLGQKRELEDWERFEPLRKWEEQAPLSLVKKQAPRFRGHGACCTPLCNCSHFLGVDLSLSLGVFPRGWDGVCESNWGSRFMQSSTHGNLHGVAWGFVLDPVCFGHRFCPVPCKLGQEQQCVAGH